MDSHGHNRTIERKTTLTEEELKKIEQSIEKLTEYKKLLRSKLFDLESDIAELQIKLNLQKYYSGYK